MITSIQLKHFKRDSVDAGLLNFTLNVREKSFNDFNISRHN